MHRWGYNSVEDFTRTTPGSNGDQWPSLIKWGHDLWRALNWPQVCNPLVCFSVFIWQTPLGVSFHQGKHGQKTTEELPTGLAQLLPNIQRPFALLQAWRSRTVAVLPQPLVNKCLLHPKGRLMKSSKIIEDELGLKGHETVVLLPPPQQYSPKRV